MPNVLSPRDLVFRPDNMDETVPHTLAKDNFQMKSWAFFSYFAQNIVCVYV